MTIAEILQPLSTRRRFDAVWLLSVLLKCSKADVLLRAREELPKEHERTWKKWWARRLKDEPLQYICASAPFYGREFFVNKNVLIPRPETERLVEIALEFIKDIQGARVLDIGTGSGAIALTMKAERPDIEMVGSDISPAALSVAKKNAELLKIEGVRFEKHDLFSPALRKYEWDLVISNPPYLEFGKDKIAADVKKWEPRQALEPTTKAKVNGVKDRAAWCADRILEGCMDVRPRICLMELSPRVAIFLEKRWKKHLRAGRIERLQDLAGRKRFLLVGWRNGLL